MEETLLYEILRRLEKHRKTHGAGELSAGLRAIERIALTQLLAATGGEVTFGQHGSVMWRRTS